TISLAPTTRVQATGNITISTADLKLGAGSVINASGSASTSAVTINSPTGTGLTIESPLAASATIQTGGGGINIAPASGQALTFLNPGANPTTLNLNGGPVNISGSNVTVGSSVTLSSDNNITITT